VFETDVTPPIGAPLCDGLVAPAKTIVDRLSARGVVLFPNGKPIVLCARRLGWNRQMAGSAPFGDHLQKPQEPRSIAFAFMLFIPTTPLAAISMRKRCLFLTA